MKGNASLAGLEKAFFKRTDLPRDMDLNYCIPINIGIISQALTEETPGQQASIEAPLVKFAGMVQKLFGKDTGASASSPSKNRTRIQYNLVTAEGDDSNMTKAVVRFLGSRLNAKRVSAASYDELKKKSWLVLALWDGIPGGTAFEAVSSILCYCPDSEISAPEAYSMILPENRPVFHLVLPVGDKKNLDAEKEKNVKNYTIRDIYPRVLESLDGKAVWFDRYHYAEISGNSDRRANFNKSAARIKLFNQAVIDYVKKKYTRTKNVWQLLDQTRGQGITPSVSAEIAEMRQICYDAISMKAQADYKREVKNVFIWAALGLLCFAIYSDLTFQPIFYFAFFALFLLAYFIFFVRLKKNGNQNFYLEFRAIAESMRVQCYWHMTGVAESTGIIYAARFSKDMSWAKYALNRWYEDDTSQGMTESGDIGNNQNKIDEAILTEFIVGQKKFFNKRISDVGKKRSQKKENYNRKAERLNRLSYLSKILWIVFGLGLAAVLGLDLSVNVFSVDHLTVTLTDILIFCMSVANVLALGVSYFSEKLLYKILVSRYTYCKLLAEKAVIDYHHSSVPHKVIFRKYGEQALAENAEWLLIENDREPDVPNG
jgi:hypothetical protein